MVKTDKHSEKKNNGNELSSTPWITALSFYGLSASSWKRLIKYFASNGTIHLIRRTLSHSGSNPVPSVRHGWNHKMQFFCDTLHTERPFFLHFTQCCPRDDSQQARGDGTSVFHTKTVLFARCRHHLAPNFASSHLEDSVPPLTAFGWRALSIRGIISPL